MSARGALARRGRFYPVHQYEQGGKRFARELRPMQSMRAARLVLDTLGVRGYVSVWSDATQQRTVGAERDADGRWWSTDPFTGRKVELAPVSPPD